MSDEMVEIAKLKGHPLNALLYDPPESKIEEFEELCRSIKENGLIEPITYNREFTILSGHRRVQACKVLGLTHISGSISYTEDEELIIIESNRYRRKTVGEIMREAEKLLEIETRKSSDASAFSSTSETKGVKTRERIAKALGVGSGYQLDKLKKIYDASKTNPNIADQIRKIDSGQTSVNAVFKAMSPKLEEDLGFDLQVYNIWNFPTVDLRIGIPHPGRIAGQTIQNLLWYFTEQGDLCVDPFGGGGITVDACKMMYRRSLVMDINPVREDIIKWDITHGYPEQLDDDPPQLIFADPPYWNMLEKEYNAIGPGSISSLSLEEFTDSMREFIENSFEILKPGGYLAIIMFPQTFKLPEGIPFMDWPIECRIQMDGVGFVPFQRVAYRFPTSLWNGTQVNAAKESKRMLQITGDIVIGVKP